MQDKMMQPGSINTSVKTYSSVEEEWALIKGLCEGKEQAYRQLYHLYGKLLFIKIKAIVKCQVTAEDLLQDTFIKVNRYIRFYNRDKGILQCWLSKLAKNTALDYQRSKLKRQRTGSCMLADCVVEIDGCSHSSLNTDGIGLSTIVLILSPAQQLLINLVYLQGYSHAEAAKQLAIPLGTVKSRTRRAIKIMRQYFY